MCSWLCGSRAMLTRKQSDNSHNLVLNFEILFVDLEIGVVLVHVLEQERQEFYLGVSSRSGYYGRQADFKLHTQDEEGATFVGAWVLTHLFHKMGKANSTNCMYCLCALIPLWYRSLCGVDLKLSSTFD